MVQTEKLKWELKAQGYDNASAAWQLGMSEQCFARKLRTGRFGTQEIQSLTELLDLECPEDIFFA